MKTFQEFLNEGFDIDKISKPHIIGTDKYNPDKQWVIVSYSFEGKTFTIYQLVKGKITGKETIRNIDDAKRILDNMNITSVKNKPILVKQGLLDDSGE